MRRGDLSREREAFARALPLARERGSGSRSPRAIAAGEASRRPADGSARRARTPSPWHALIRRAARLWRKRSFRQPERNPRGLSLAPLSVAEKGWEAGLYRLDVLSAEGSASGDPPARGRVRRARSAWTPAGSL